MESHFTYLSPLVESADAQKFIAALALGTGLVFLAQKNAKKIATAGVDSLVVPSPAPSAFGLFDFFMEAFISFHDSILGKKNRKYAPLCGSIFLFVFCSNLLGLVPGMPAITTTVWVNVGLAMVVFFAFNMYGIRASGVKGYLAHFCGPIAWLAWLIFPLEILSTTLRILTLNLRLYWNISADHIVMGVFTKLIYGVPIVFYLMGTVVAFMQAFVFTILTMIYILLATSHGDHEHADGGHHH